MIRLGGFVDHIAFVATGTLANNIGVFDKGFPKLPKIRRKIFEIF